MAFLASKCTLDSNFFRNVLKNQISPKKLITLSKTDKSVDIVLEIMNENKISYNTTRKSKYEIITMLEKVKKS